MPSLLSDIVKVAWLIAFAVAVGVAILHYGSFPR